MRLYKFSYDHRYHSHPKICRERDSHIVQILLWALQNCHPHLGTWYKSPSHCSNPSPSASILPSPPGNSIRIAVTLFKSFSEGWEPITNCCHIVRILLWRAWNLAAHLGTCTKSPSHRLNPSLRALNYHPSGNSIRIAVTYVIVIAIYRGYEYLVGGTKVAPPCF